MPCMSNLQKHPKSGVYRINKRIPKAAQAAFGGRKVFLKSLGTKDFAEAKRKQLTALAEFQAGVDRALGGSLVIDPNDLSYTKTFFANHSDWSGKMMNLVRLYELGKNVVYRDRTEFQSDLDEFSKIYFNDPQDRERFRKYLEDTTPDLYPGMNRAPRVNTETKSINLSELEAKLIGQSDYARSSVKECRKAFSYLRELFGDCPARDIQPGHILELRDLLLRYPVTGRTTAIRNMGIREAAQADHEHTLSPKSVGKIFS